MLLCFYYHLLALFCFFPNFISYEVGDIITRLAALMMIVGSVFCAGLVLIMLNILWAISTPAAVSTATLDLLQYWVIGVHLRTPRMSSVWLTYSCILFIFPFVIFFLTHIIV